MKNDPEQTKDSIVLASDKRCPFFAPYEQKYNPPRIRRLAFYDTCATDGGPPPPRIKSASRPVGLAAARVARPAVPQNGAPAAGRTAGPVGLGTAAVPRLTVATGARPPTVDRVPVKGRAAPPRAPTSACPVADPYRETVLRRRVAARVGEAVGRVVQAPALAPEGVAEATARLPVLVGVEAAPRLSPALTAVGVVDPLTWPLVVDGVGPPRPVGLDGEVFPLAPRPRLALVGAPPTDTDDAVGVAEMAAPPGLVLGPAAFDIPAARGLVADAARARPSACPVRPCRPSLATGRVAVPVALPVAARGPHTAHVAGL